MGQVRMVETFLQNRFRFGAMIGAGLSLLWGVNCADAALSVGPDTRTICFNMLLNGTPYALCYPLYPPATGLTAQIVGGPTAASHDFQLGSNQFYDMYLSNGDGTFDTSGDFISIVCNSTDTSPGYPYGNVVDFVDINVLGSPSQTFYVTGVSSMALGTLNDDCVAHGGYAGCCLGTGDGQAANLGTGLTRLTLGFAVPEPASLAVLGLGAIAVLRRSRRRVLNCA